MVQDPTKKSEAVLFLVSVLGMSIKPIMTSSISLLNFPYPMLAKDELICARTEAVTLMSADLSAKEKSILVAELYVLSQQEQIQARNNMKGF